MIGHFVCSQRFSFNLWIFEDYIVLSSDKKRRNLGRFVWMLFTTLKSTYSLVDWMIWIEHLIYLSSSLQKYTVVYSARFIQSGPYQRSVHFTRANEQIELIKQ